MPVICMALARMSAPSFNLAAFGGVIFPVTLLIGSPMLMVLAASTSLCDSIENYRRFFRFVYGLSGLLIIAQLLLTHTQLYDLVVGQFMGIDGEAYHLARLGLTFATPWPFFVAHRRANQGVLIRLGASQIIGMSSFYRLTILCTVLILGLNTTLISGTVLAASALTLGLGVEMLYTHRMVQKRIGDKLTEFPENNELLSLTYILVFYLPLALMALMRLVVQPIGISAMTRLNQNALSLPVWPVVVGFIFTTLSFGLAVRELTISLADRKDALSALRTFTAIIGGMTSLLIFLTGTTPLGTLWFSTISGLDTPLAALAISSMLYCVPLPYIRVWGGYFQGILVSERKTEAISKAVFAEVIIVSIILGVARLHPPELPGIQVFLVALCIGASAQTLYLRWRARLATNDGITAIPMDAIGQIEQV